MPKFRRASLTSSKTMGWQPPSYVQIFLEPSSPLLAREAVVFEGTAVLPRYFICSTKTCEGMYFTVQMIILRLSTRSTYRNISKLETPWSSEEVWSHRIYARCDYHVSYCSISFTDEETKFPSGFRRSYARIVVDHYVLASTIISNLRWTSFVVRWWYNESSMYFLRHRERNVIDFENGKLIGRLPSSLSSRFREANGGSSSLLAGYLLHF